MICLRLYRGIDPLHQGGQQEDAEEFFGFYLDTLEEELLLLSSTLDSKAAAAPKIEDKEEDAPREDGWMEVGKRNKTVVTRTVRTCFCVDV